MATSISISNLPPDPDYDPSLDPSAGTLIPSPFLPYTHAIVPYPFDPCNIFNKPMFFMTEHLVGDRPAIVASQKVVVEEMRKLREEEEEAQRINTMPEFEVKLERDIDINDRRMWRKKLGWAKAQESALRTQRYRFYTFVTLSRLLFGFRDRYDWVHKKGRWERATWYDRDYTRRNYICEVLEWIDEVRYRVEDEWNATHATAKREKESVRRKRKSTPDNLTEAMRNAPRRRIEPAVGASEQEVVEVSERHTENSGAPAVHVGQFHQQVREQITGSTYDILERDRPNKLLSEAPTAHLSSSCKEDEEIDAEVRHRLKPDSPEVADSSESSEYCDLLTSPAGQTAGGMDSNGLERTENDSDLVIISSDDEDVELAPTKISMDLTTVDDVTDNTALAENEDVSEALQNDYRSSPPACITPRASVKSPWVSINLYCGDSFQFRSMRMKRKARFETLTSVVCDQESIPRNEARFRWKGEDIDLNASPDTCAMGEEEEIHLYHVLASPFKMYPWHIRLMNCHQSVMVRPQDREKESHINIDLNGHTVINEPNAKTSNHTTPKGISPAPNAAVPQTPLSHGFPRLTLQSQAPGNEPSPQAKKLAIEAGFGNYSFLNTLRDDERRMWSAFLGDRRVAGNALRTIANIYREPRSPGFTQKLIQRIADQYPLFQEAIKQR